MGAAATLAAGTTLFIGFILSLKRVTSFCHFYDQHWGNGVYSPTLILSWLHKFCCLSQSCWQRQLYQSCWLHLFRYTQMEAREALYRHTATNRSHTRSWKLQPAEIENTDLKEFLEDLENPRTPFKPFFIRVFIVALIWNTKINI